jgi:hypothetical protein
LLALMAFGMTLNVHSADRSSVFVDALATPVVYFYFDDPREIDSFALVRRWTSIGVYGRRDSAAQAD